ncbi:hypothetical protein BURMUCGD1_4182 [Burkholderia multivorans CGD1]|nr:hypothetical protein BURMUCGD1_4182 [Burkholderia multivorans CGD1]
MQRDLERHAPRRIDLHDGLPFAFDVSIIDRRRYPENAEAANRVSGSA